MAKNTLPPELRKQPVSVSLTALEIIMLDNLAKVGKTNRSALLADLIRGRAYSELGLSALEVHAAPVQRTKTGDCNPHNVNGRCTHSRCVQIYRELGI